MRYWSYLIVIFILCIAITGCTLWKDKEEDKTKEGEAKEKTSSAKKVEEKKEETKTVASKTDLSSKKEAEKKAETIKTEVKTSQPPVLSKPITPPVKETPKETYISEANSKPLKKLTICLCWQIQCQFAGYYAALENGFYKEEGLDVTLKPGGPNIRPYVEVSEDRAQFGTGQAQEVLIARDKNIPIQCVSTNFQTGALRLIAKKSLGIVDPLDLRGKKISLWFGGYEYQCLGLLERYGISKDDVTLVKQEWSMDPFINGEVDVASVMVYNELNTVYEKGVRDIDILSYADYGINFPEDTVFALEQYIKDNPEIVSKVLRASYRGWKWAMENPKETISIVIKYGENLTVEHETGMLREVIKLMVNNNTQKNGLGYINRADWFVMARILFQQKLLNTMPDINQAINSSFIDKIKILPPENMPKF